MTQGTARLGALEQHDEAAADVIRGLLDLAPRGLSAAYVEPTAEFAQTVRAVSGSAGVAVRPEGRNLRYAAMAALGLALVEEDVQRTTLAGRTASEVVSLADQRALTSDDPGAVALIAWAEAEINGVFRGDLFDRLLDWLTSGAPLPTVDVSWMLTAAGVAAGLGETKQVVDLVTQRLIAEQGSHGIFPHWLPASSQSRWRSHVGSFADQVYPIQALARAFTLTGDQRLLAAADETAARICELQGAAGQWWWHYDIRDGTVVEGYPVYSVHQHAMAPMILHDLREAGGADHLASVAAGIRWLDTHPEVLDELVSERFGLVWRKVGRRESGKAARAVAAATTSLRPGLHLPGLTRLLPPVVIDHECRPYELGWLLYAWLSDEGSDHA